MPRKTICHSIKMRSSLLREKVSPGVFSSYRKFFSGTKWEIFAAPYEHGNAFDERICAAKTEVLPISAVYEFAVSKKPFGGKRHKVYIGQTHDMKSRCIHYMSGDNRLAQTNHIAYFMHAALESGLFVHYRVKYLSVYATRTKADLMGFMWLTRILSSYNYAWCHNNMRVPNNKRGKNRVAKKVSFLWFSRVKFFEI